MAVQRSMTTARPPAAATRAASTLTMPELQPQAARPDGDRLLGMRYAQLGAPEDIHDVHGSRRGDRRRDIGIARQSQHRRLVRVDRDARHSRPP